MRIIKNSRLKELAARHPASLPAVLHWKKHITAKPDIANFAQLRARFPHADQATSKSKRTLTIFNLANHHRLITAIHYNRQIVYIHRLLTHAEYDKNNWKNEL